MSGLVPSVTGPTARLELNLADRHFVCGRASMQDLVFILITIAFFALAIGYVRFCDRVK
ncbi:MAG: hypothetical protein ACHQKY_13770 [Terriglobia bacterium]